MRNNRFFYLSLITTLLALFVVVLGAYTRLTDAGLGCPDWPGCYGKLLVPNPTEENSHQIDQKKAWTEMVHRYCAGALSLLVFALCVSSYKNKKSLKSAVRNRPTFLAVFGLLTVCLQAALGMWTVTLKLMPMIVMLHLLGGLTLLSLLWILTLQAFETKKQESAYCNATFTTPNRQPPWDLPATKNTSDLKWIKTLSLLALCVVAIQIALGGWTSANYAALVCRDFPVCHVGLDPTYEWGKAFNWEAGVIPGMGEPLSLMSKMTIHMAHRFMAIIAMICLLMLVYALQKNKKEKGNTGFFLQALSLKRFGLVILFLTVLQILLGISNILAHLPLFVAVLHNGVAAVLLLTLIALNYQLQRVSTNVGL